MRQKNLDRAERAAAAVETWRAQRGDPVDEANARDLITDLLHLIERDGEESEGGPAVELETALNNYEAERDGIDDVDEDEGDDIEQAANA